MTVTDWLTEDEQHAWRLYQEMSMVLDAALDRQLQRDADMPHTYYTLLVILAAAPRSTCRMTALAQATSTSQSRTSHAVAALEKRGWVRRERCTDDSRGTLAVLTAAGKRVLKDAAPEHVKLVRSALFDRLSARQVSQLAAICATVLAGFDQG